MLANWGALHAYLDGAWVNAAGDGVGWTAEIYNFEDDMAGTAGNKCPFTNCGYKQSGDGTYRNPGISASDIFSNDSNEWGIEAAGSDAINIWDKKPR